MIRNHGVGHGSSCMRSGRIAAAVVTALVVGLGCTQHHQSTKPNEITTLPAINLSDNPVTKKTDWQAMTKVNDSVFSLSFVGLSDVENRNADIQIQFTHPEEYPYSDIFVIDSSTGKRYALQRHIPGVMSFGPRLGSCLLSTSTRPMREFLFGPDRLLFVVSSQITEPSARLIVYEPNYRVVTVSSVFNVWTFAYDHGRLWVFVMPFDETSRPDSVRVLSATGEPVQTLPWPWERIINMTWSEQGLWTMHGSQPVRLTLRDSALSFLGEFTLPGYVDRVTPGMTWAAGKLWVLDRYASQFLGIDTDSSLITGAAVIPDTITSSQEIYWSHGLAWNDEHLCLNHSGRLLRFALNGDTATSLPLPKRVMAMAWDGQAMWILHMGAGDATTDAMLLSRFFLQ